MTVHLSLENFFLLTSSTSVTSAPPTFLPITKQKLKSKFKLSTIFDLNFQFEFLGREEFAPIIIKGLDQSLPSQARTSRYYVRLGVNLHHIQSMIRYSVIFLYNGPLFRILPEVMLEKHFELTSLQFYYAG